MGAEPSSDSGEVAARLAALDGTVRAVDARVDALDRAQRVAAERLERLVADGFQEVASRALVLAEATDEILGRHAAALERIEAQLATMGTGDDDEVARLRASFDALSATFEAAGPAREESERRIADLTVALARLQATVDGIAGSTALADVRAEVSLVSERLSALLGGPSLTELMDRIDELGDSRPSEEPKRRRRFGGAE